MSPAREWLGFKFSFDKNWRISTSKKNDMDMKHKLKIVQLNNIDGNISIKLLTYRLPINIGVTEPVGARVSSIAKRGLFKW